MGLVSFLTQVSTLMPPCDNPLAQSLPVETWMFFVKEFFAIFYGCLRWGCEKLARSLLYREVASSQMGCDTGESLIGTIWEDVEGFCSRPWAPGCQSDAPSAISRLTTHHSRALPLYRTRPRCSIDIDKDQPRSLLWRVRLSRSE